MTMTLAEAIAEVKRVYADVRGVDESDEVRHTILAAVASDQLIPRTDAEQAVALAYQRAADEAGNFSTSQHVAHSIREGVFPEQTDIRCAIHDAILALAPADALAEVERLREALADAAGALDSAGEELSDFANILSREPWQANHAYESAVQARAALQGQPTEYEVKLAQLKKDFPNGI